MPVNRLKVGKGFSLSSDVVTQASAILGIRGSGKSTTARTMVEQAMRVNQRVVIIDPTDVWWGMKSSRDGKKPGLPIVVLGGEHGDLPLPETSGKLIADFVVVGSQSTILSVRHLRKAAQIRFVTAFMEQLYFLKGKTKHRDPLLIVIDECDTYVPQKPRGDVARCIGAIEDAVKRGRAGGIGAILISQRPASVNKDVLTQVDTLVCHRVSAPHDRRAFADWIEAHDTQGYGKEFIATLPSLKTGQAWFWSPACDIFTKVDVNQPETFDSSSTPKLGKRPPVPKTMAKIDLYQLKVSLASIAGEAKSNDTTTLKRTIRELQAKLERKPKVERVQTVDISGLDGLTAKLQRFTNVHQQLVTATRNMANLVLAFSDAVAKMRGSGKRLSSIQSPPTNPVDSSVPSAEPSPKVPQPGDYNPGGGALRMVTALAMRYPVLVSESQWAILARLKRSGGTWSTYKGRLMKAGLVQKRGNLYIATQLAIDEHGDSQATPETREEILDMWKSKLGKRPGDLIDLIEARGSEGITKEELAEESELTANAGTFTTYLSRIRVCGLLREEGGRIYICETI